jgi:DNA-binding transcriptional LysR family regulator
MAAMDTARLSGFDLNLLVVLDVLLAERNVTRAATRLGLSQPAVSNALARLRAALNDPLLVRTRQGMAPTPRALALVGSLRDALDLMGNTLTDAESFDPSTAKRTFVLAATDYVQFVLLGKLVHRIRRCAPQVTLEVLPIMQQFPWQQLEAGSIDIVLGGVSTRESPRALHRRRLFRDRVVCILRAGHAYASGTLTLEHYLDMAHVEALPLGTHGLADEVLAQMGAERRTSVTVPHFLVAPYIVVQSDCCFTLAERIAVPMAEQLPLVVRPLPFEMPSVSIAAYWHDRVHGDAAHRWLRRLVAEVTGTLDGADMDDAPIAAERATA